MRVSVKAEFPYAGGEKFMRQAVNGGFVRNGAVKRGVENGHMRDIRQRFLAGIDTSQHGGMMQRHQGNKPPDFVNHALINDHGAAVQRAAVTDAVRHGVDFLQVLNRRSFHAGYCLKDKVQRGAMIRRLNFRQLFFVTAGARMICLFRADARDRAAHERLLGVEVKNLIF